MMKQIVAAAAMAAASMTAAGDSLREPLYPNGIPDASDTDNFVPELLWYPASEVYNTGKCVVVFPGGGYGGLCWTYEGEDVGHLLQAHGITVAVCLYRCCGVSYKHPIPLNDAKAAMKRVRERADEFKFKKDQVGVMGFSAGGHVAASVMTAFDKDSRPDFGILCYPVISMQKELTHKGSRDNLLGQDPPQELVNATSCELNVTSNTPPAFIWACSTDQLVPSLNSVKFYEALRKNGVDAELHIFKQGLHGGALCVGNERGLPRDIWLDLMFNWLRTF